MKMFAHSFTSLCLLDLLTVSFIPVKSLWKAVTFSSLNEAIVTTAKQVRDFYEINDFFLPLN